jgi:hypothetical protein
VTPQRLHPLWFTPMLPLLFITSAIGAGLMFVVLVKILYARWYDPESVFGPSTPKSELDGETRRASGRDMPMLVQLATIAAGVLGIYLLLQIYNLLAGGSWRALLAGTWESWLFGVELLISAILPVLLVALPRTRRSPGGLGLAAGSAAAGLALNRLDVGVFGYFRDAGVAYFPSLTEWAVSAGVVAAAGLAFLFVTENFAVFNGGWKPRRVAPGAFRATFDSFSRVSRTVLSSGLERVTAVAVIVVPLAWVAMYPPFDDPVVVTVRPASGLDAMRDTLRINGDQAGVWTDFPHADHQSRLGGEDSCRTCHHLSLPGDRNTPCSRCHTGLLQPALIFDHERHWGAVARSKELTGAHPSNRSCAECHRVGEPKTASSARPCLECHRTDTRWADEYDESADLARAVSYLEAMHGRCIKCHEEEGRKENRRELADCMTCHRSPDPYANVGRWVVQQWLPDGELLYKLADPDTGETRADLDLAWPAGMKEGSNQPVAILIGKGPELEFIVRESGYRFKKRYRDDSLRLTEYGSQRDEVLDASTIVIRPGSGEARAPPNQRIMSSPVWNTGESRPILLITAMIDWNATQHAMPNGRNPSKPIHGISK